MAEWEAMRDRGFAIARRVCMAHASELVIGIVQSKGFKALTSDVSWRKTQHAPRVVNRKSIE